MPVLVLDHCRACGETASIVRSQDGELHCELCGAPERLLGGYEVPPPGPRFDVGQSAQVCPICSTVDREVLGIFDRPTGRFNCGACGATFGLGAYERQLEEYRTVRWRALTERRRYRELLERRAG